jgi:uncharacterized UPF0160 family protein
MRRFPNLPCCTPPGHSIKLSSAGLVYKHFGREVVAAELGVPSSDASVETVYLKVYASFMEALDGIDNGVAQYEGATKARYESHTHLSARVGALNPSWNEEWETSVVDARFAAAMALTGAEFSGAVAHAGRVWLPARTHVVDALASARAVHPSGAVIRLPQFCPWKDHLFELEAAAGGAPAALYVLFADTKGDWRVAAVPESPDSFASRKALPAPWRGLRDAALAEACGVPDAVFCHSSGFIGGAVSEAGATAMALAAVAFNDAA